jgi:hypothetical protein
VAPGFKWAGAGGEHIDHQTKKGLGLKAQQGEREDQGLGD